MKVLLIVVILVIFIVILLSRKKHKSSRISSPSIYTSTDKNKETVLEPKSQFNSIPLYEEEGKKSVIYETLEDDTKTTSTNNNSYSLPPKKVYKSVYDYLLHDSRWLDCRNRILKRDGYRCNWCGEKYKYDLQIHHKYYHKLPNNHFVNPWEYDDDCFITLCKTCHDKFHENHNNKVYYRSYKEHRSLLKRLKENERNKNKTRIR